MSISNDVRVAVPIEIGALAPAAAPSNKRKSDEAE